MEPCLGIYLLNEPDTRGIDRLASDCSGFVRQLKDNQSESRHFSNLEVAYFNLGEVNKLIECY